MNDFEELALIYEGSTTRKSGGGFGPSTNPNGSYSADPSKYSYGKGQFTFNGTGGKYNAYAAGMMNSGITAIGDEEEPVISGIIDIQEVLTMIAELLKDEDDQPVIFALAKLKEQLKAKSASRK